MAGLSPRGRALALLGASLAGSAAAADVDLAKSVHPQAVAAWAGQEVGHVLDAARIGRVVLTRAVTSTTAAHDIAGIRQVLADCARVRFADSPRPGTFLRMGAQDAVWEAVIVMDDGQVFGFSSGVDQACLIQGDGSHGCFARPAAL